MEIKSFLSLFSLITFFILVWRERERERERERDENDGSEGKNRSR
jgi:hypothetical protein